MNFTMLVEGFIVIITMYLGFFFHISGIREDLKKNSLAFFGIYGTANEAGHEIHNLDSSYLKRVSKQKL